MAQQDPNWGRKGPPDLDELIRQLQQRIARLFGGMPPPKGPPPPRGPSTGPHLSGVGVGAVAAALVALWLASGFYIVDASEQGAVLRMGRFSHLTEPGLQWHLPYPFEQAEVVPLTQVRSVEVGYRSSAKNRVPEESLMLTQDQNIIDVQLSVQYDVKDARAFLFNNYSSDGDARDIIKQIAETAIREVVGRSKVDFVLNEGRAQIAADTTHVMQGIADHYGLGVRITKVNINDVQPPQQVLAAFDDAVKAGQDKDRLRNDGLAYANDVVPKAKGLAARLLAEAEGYRQKVVENAHGDASRFSQVLSEYNKAPKVMRDRLYLDMMQQVMSNTSKVLVDQKNGNSLLYLPLDKLIAATNAGASVAGPASVAPGMVPEAAVPSAPHSGRNLTRGRDAEERQ